MASTILMSNTHSDLLMQSRPETNSRRKGLAPNASAHKAIPFSRHSERTIKTKQDSTKASNSVSVVNQFLNERQSGTLQKSNTGLISDFNKSLATIHLSRVESNRFQRTRPISVNTRRAEPAKLAQSDSVSGSSKHDRKLLNTLLQTNSLEDRPIVAR